MQIKQEKSLKVHESCYVFLENMTNRMASCEWFFARLGLILIARASLGYQECVWIGMEA